MTVVTRFAPSPTGFLHIGGARTALFNWLYSKHNDGIFRLRVEDTDRKRSTEEAIDAILHGLKWLGLDWDDDVVFQSQNQNRHAEVVEELLKKGAAYRCYASQQELEEMREKARAEGRPIRYDGRWRDRDPAEAPAGADPVIRIRMPQEGETVIEDMVQGTVRVANEHLDDMVLLRADGTPTYMLSVVVDDHDMGITDVIRGDDHLNNAFRQAQVFLAMGWDLPRFAHIPLIHGSDGAKMSKRHGALGVEAYEEMGMLPEAMCNYLLRLGWGHGDDEIISRDQAVKWFDLGDVGRSASRFDMQKLEHLNAHYLREADDERLVALAAARLTRDHGLTIDDAATDRLRRGMGGLKARARTLVDLAESAAFYVREMPLPMNDKAKKLLADEAVERLSRFAGDLEALAAWTQAELEQATRTFAEREEIKLGQIAQPLRAALTGSNASPGIFEVMEILGKQETINRVRNAAP